MSLPTTKKTKLVLVGSFLLVLALAAVGAVVLVDFESPALGDELLRRANEASAMNLSADGFRLSLTRGAELRGLKARSRMPGVRYDLELESLLFRHVPRELLEGRLHVERVVASSPRVTIRVGDESGRETAAAPASRPRSPVSPPPETEESEESSTELLFEVALDVSELDIRDGAFLVQQTTDDVVRLLLDGVDLSLAGLDYDRNAVTVLHGVSASGRIGVRELRFASTSVRDLAARIALSRGRLELDELALENEDRRWAGRLSVDANSIPFRYEIDLEGGPFDALPFARTVDVRVQGRGFGFASENFTGSGAAMLTGGTLPDSAWVRSLEEASGNGRLVGASYERSELAFRLEDGVLRFEPFTLTLEVPSATLSVTGTVSLEGVLALDVALDGVVYRLRGDVEAPSVARSP